MRSSKFNPDLKFSKETWLAHLVNSENNLLLKAGGGHAMLFIEGQNQAGSIVLRRYDIKANSNLFSSSGSSARENKNTHLNVKSFVHNVRILRDIIPEEGDLESAYQKICGNTGRFDRGEKRIYSGTDTYTVTEDQANQLDENCVNDLKNIVKGVAFSFLTAKAKNGYEFFNNCEDLSKVQTTTDGNTVPTFSDSTNPDRQPIHVFIEDYCAGIYNYSDILEKNMYQFMIIINTVLLRFLTANLAKMAKNNLLSNLIPCFKILGPRALGVSYSSDLENNNSSIATNCMHWCRVHLKKVGINTIYKTNNPKYLGLKPSPKTPLLAATEENEQEFNKDNRKTCSIM